MHPSIGRIVHYSDELATCNAAIVTGLSELEHEPPDVVTLMVFPASEDGEAIADVSSGSPDHIGTWHWPERAGGGPADVVNAIWGAPLPDAAFDTYSNTSGPQEG